MNVYNLGTGRISRIALLGVFIFCSLKLAGGDFREFSNSDGVRIEAEVLEATATVVTIRRQDGKVFRDVPLERFCKADRNYVKQWLANKKELQDNADISADSKVKLFFMKGRDNDMNDYGDIDDRILNFEPAVVITSEEKIVSYPDVEGTFVVVGQGVVRDDQYTILNKQDFSIGVFPRQKSRWEGESFECRYDPDYGGFEYGGYLLVIRNRAGNIVLTKASKSHWEKHPNAIQNAKKFQGYDSKFEKKSSLYTTFVIPR